MWLAWRLFYSVLGSTPIVLLLGAALDLVGCVKGAQAVEDLLGGVERRWVFSGWPHQRRGWINLHVSRLVWHLRRRHAQMRPKRSAPVRSHGWRLRIGCVGAFSGTLSFDKLLFEHHPQDVDVFVFDFSYRGQFASYLEPLVSDYCALGEAGTLDAQQLDRAAATIDAADLDLLVNVSQKRDAYDVIDRVTTPCLAHWCAGSDLLHHDKLDFHLFDQPQADYFVRDEHIFCATTHAPLGPERVFQMRGFYDARGLGSGQVPAWREREPLIVWFGSLYKIADPEFLDCVMDLLTADSSLQFVFMGKDMGGALAAITGEAKRRGIESRVQYDGVYSAIRDESGAISDPAWNRLVSYVRRARLSPNPWPVGGGSTRFEAYLMGVPSVHMGVRFDRAAWARPQRSVCEVPVLLVPRATAFSLDHYQELCRRCLYDEQYADDVIREQREVAAVAADPSRWWRQLVDIFEAYRARH